MADSNSNGGGAGGYCLPVQGITWLQLYVYSFLFHLGVFYQQQETKLINAIANCRTIFR